MYLYNYAHNAASIANIMAKLAAADNVRNLAKAPGPLSKLNNTPGLANTVVKAIMYIRRLVFATAVASSGFTSDAGNFRAFCSRGKLKKAPHKTNQTLCI